MQAEKVSTKIREGLKLGLKKASPKKVAPKNLLHRLACQKLEITKTTP